MSVLCLALFTHALFYTGEAFNVNKLERCSIKNENCLKSFYEKAIYEYGKSGIPELGLPPLEPMIIKNISAPVIEVLASDPAYTLFTSGVMKGMTNCSYHNLNIDLNQLRIYLEVTCDLVVEGTILLLGRGEAVKSVFGNFTIESRGLGRLNFGKMHIIYDVKFKIFKKDDGEIYWGFDSDHVKYNYDVQNVSFSGKNFFFGNADISAMMVDYFTSNCRELVNSIGDKFLSQSINQYFANLNKLFGNIPLRKYIIEDLSSYL